MQKRPKTTPLSREEIRERRNYFLTNAKTKSKIYRGDKRVHGGRLCAICHTQLSTTILATGKSEATRDHHRCYFSPLVEVSLCKDSRVCHKVHDKLRKDKEE